VYGKSLNSSVMKTLILFAAVISTVRSLVELESSWRELEMESGCHSKQFEYIDFNPLDTRIHMRLTQLRPEDNLEFGVEYGFFEEEKRSSFVSSVNFEWHTKPGHKSGLFLHVGEDFSDCIEENPEMLIIPTSTSIDLNSDYTVELNNGKVRGSFKNRCEQAEDGSDTWASWKRSVEKIRKLAVKVTDSKLTAPGINLSDFFTLEYRVVKACPIGTYLSDRYSLCLDCEADHYSPGGYPNECTRCPLDSFVPPGAGFSERNCTFWYSCPGGYYQDDAGRCKKCSPGHYSPGGDAFFCHPCPDDSYADPGSRRCIACPDGTVVGTGRGTSVNDCQEAIYEESGATAICRTIPFIQAMLVSAYCLL